MVIYKELLKPWYVKMHQVLGSNSRANLKYWNVALYFAVRSFHNYNSNYRTLMSTWLQIISLNLWNIYILQRQSLSIRIKKFFKITFLIATDILFFLWDILSHTIYLKISFISIAVLQKFFNSKTPFVLGTDVTRLRSLWDLKKNWLKFFGRIWSIPNLVGSPMLSLQFLRIPESLYFPKSLLFPSLMTSLG